ncbi:hypothetical protein [Streptomyces cinereoruber]|uniref:hypothetical protein n=1 Tax=Streptomyces cinereoruber TaxID=67260 RepID=UPI00362F62C9
MAKKKPKGWTVRERIARQNMRRQQERAQWHWEKVYGRKDEPAPPEEPSTSVRAVPSSLESNRRRH